MEKVGQLLTLDPDTTEPPCDQGSQKVRIGVLSAKRKPIKKLSVDQYIRYVGQISVKV